MRQRFCRMCRQWHELDAWPMECFEAPKAQSDSLAIPYFISDTMEPTQHPLDQRHYTSKSTFEKITRDAGYETVGNDPARLRPPPKPKADKAGIKAAVEKASARFRRGERVAITT